MGKKKLKSLPTVNNYIDDILSISRILQWAGISFGQNTWFKLRYSLNVNNFKQNLNKKIKIILIYLLETS